MIKLILVGDLRETYTVVKCFPFFFICTVHETASFLEALKHYWGTFVFSFSNWERIWLQKSKAIIGTFMYILLLKWKDLKYYVSIYVCVYVYVFACTYECAHTNAPVRTHDFSSLIRFLVHFPNECIYDWAK